MWEWVRDVVSTASPPTHLHTRRVSRQCAHLAPRKQHMCVRYAWGGGRCTLAGGPSGCPVIDSRPPMAATGTSYAAWCARGPVCPNPVREQYTSRGFTDLMSSYLRVAWHGHGVAWHRVGWGGMAMDRVGWHGMAWA